MKDIETPLWRLTEGYRDEVEQDEDIANQVEIVPLILSLVVSRVHILLNGRHFFDFIIECNFKLQLSHSSFHFLAFNLVDCLSSAGKLSCHGFVVASAHWLWRVSIIRHIKINYY